MTILGYPISHVLFCEASHALAGLLLLAPFYLMFSGSRPSKWGTICLCLSLFSLAWVLHIALDGLQPWF